ncbi:glycosyltransferase [Microvirga sp. M2]|uniref:glycosyltransferase n=1 Tax=Microvirga sp. M2 TaxID=3073270 RepID=UPI0039C44CCE
MRAHNYNAAAAYLETVRTKKVRTWRALLLCYFAAHRFEDLIAAYEKMPAASRGDNSCRYYFALASANLEQPDPIVRVVEEVLDEPNSEAASRFLSKVYPLAERLLPDRKAMIVGRIITHGEHLALDCFDDILKCAHILREKGRESEAARLEDALRQAADTEQRRTKLDIYEAQIHFWGRRYELQMASVNNALARQGIDPLALVDERLPLSCANLKSIAGSAVPVRGPLVSILMPARNCADTIGYALDSLRRQTYQDFEVIVVDDASSDMTVQIAAQFSAADSRFRVIPLAQRSGTFVARNRALSAAVGEYVTNQDADDWAQPQKIEMAATTLQKDHSIIATWVEHVRCSDSRGFRMLNGYIRPDASSLMFRRRPVMEKIGWYDSVRAAGDGEFHLRMERSFGHGSIRQLNKLLSFVHWSEHTLSGGGPFQIDGNMDIFSPVRNEYSRSFRTWHETSSNLYMPFPLKERLFPAPSSLLC